LSVAKDSRQRTKGSGIGDCPRPNKGHAAKPRAILTTAAIGMRFAPVAPALPAPQEKKPTPKKPRATRNDPKLAAAARDLRDRWLEQVKAGGAGVAQIESRAKYDVVRALDDRGRRRLSATAGVRRRAAA
jgi:hypothetical protein